jgi:hypothetical protein
MLVVPIGKGGNENANQHIVQRTRHKRCTMAATKHYVIIGLLLLLVGCNVFATTVVTAEFSDDDIRSGQTTELRVNAENKGTASVTGYFEVYPDNPTLVSISRDDRKFTLNSHETTGVKVFKVTATASSAEQAFDVSVVFKDATTGKELGRDKVTLEVSK